MVASADPGKDTFKVHARFPTSGTREQALEFCNTFNVHLVVVRAQVQDTSGPDGRGTVIFDYDPLAFDGERIEAKAIVKTVRRFEALLRNGIARYDEDGIV